jgi:ureidoglycolate hydrolase
MAKQITAVPVTVEAFGKYGKLFLHRPQQEPYEDTALSTLWYPLVQHPAGESRTIVLLMEKQRPMVLTKLERHVRTMEIFYCVGGRCVACFAPATNPDDPHEQPPVDRIEAFIMDGVAAFTVERGQWHHPGFPITGTASQFVDIRTGTVEEDVENRDLPEPVAILL